MRPVFTDAGEALGCVVSTIVVLGGMVALFVGSAAIVGVWLAFVVRFMEAVR